MAAPDSHLRVEVRYSLLRDLRAVYEGHANEVPVRLPDFSQRGMFISTTCSFPEGTVLKVSFRLTGSGYEVKTRAEVRYCLPGVGLGLEFVELPPDARRAIGKELAVYTRHTRKSQRNPTVTAIDSAKPSPVARRRRGSGRTS